MGKAEALALVRVSLFLVKDLRLGTERGETVKICVWERRRVAGIILLCLSAAGIVDLLVRKKLIRLVK